MAINYLNNVDFNRNELQDAQLIRSQVENQPNDAAVGGTPVEGQLYFNTTSDVLKIYGNGSWSEVGGGVISLALSDGTYIDVNSTGTAANPVFAPDLNAVDGTAVAATRFLSKDNTWDVPAFPALPTVNNGTLTMTTSTGLDGGTQTFSANQAGNTTFAVSLDLNELPTGGTLIATDSIIALNGAVESKQLISAIPLSIFNNDLPTASDATITLAAGDILDGGGAFTLNQSASETITFDLATGGIGAGTYGTTSDSNKIDNFTVDAYGRIIAFATGPTGQVNTVTSSNTSTLTATGTINKTLTAVTAAVVDGGASLATGDQIYDFVTGQIANIPSGLAFEGNWNASTDTPDLSGASPDNGQFWIVSVAGNTNLDGITDWKVGDWAIYVSTGAGTDGWQKVDNTSTLSGSGVANQLTYWTGTANVAGDAGLTYDATGNNLTVGGTVTSSGGNSGEWNNSYDNMITALNVAGTTTKTLTATQQDGGTLTASWTDNDSGGTVTNIATSGPITGGPITSTGTIGITTASAGIIGAGAVAAGTGISVAYASGIATVTNTQTNSANTYAGTITDSVSGTTFNHGLGEDVIVQLYDTTNKDTVYADVVRNGNYLNISFSSTPTNSIRVLVQKIG